MLELLSSHIALVIPVSVALFIALILLSAGVWYIGRPFMGFMDGLNEPDGRTAGPRPRKSKTAKNATK